MEFRLLIPSSSADADTPTLQLAGQPWKLSQPFDLSTDAIPAYACISYRWGADRRSHAFRTDAMMSSHTLPALQAAMETSQCSVFWTDALCVPATGPARQATLEAMGYIYAQAREVVIVLGSAAAAVLREMQTNPLGKVNERALATLEADEWVESVWTYQEIVNGQGVSFVAEGVVGMEGNDFFSALGYSLSQLQLVGFAVQRRFPHLDALLTVLADWQVAAFTHRSVFAAMCSLAIKRNTEPANYFYAILGALSASPADLVWPQQSLGEKFMAVCEAKGDFSFMYCVAERDKERTWRPVAEEGSGSGSGMPRLLRPILAWDCWGEAQQGRLDEQGHLRLDGMVIMLEGSLTAQTRTAVYGWLGKVGEQGESAEEPSESSLIGMVYETLQSIGFEGHAQPLVTKDGLVFTHRKVESKEITRILIATQIRYPFGAPGLVQVQEQEKEQMGEERYMYVPCLFLGSIADLLGGGEDVILL